MEFEKHRFPEKNMWKRLRGIMESKGENLSTEEIDKLIEKETEELLRKEL